MARGENTADVHLNDSLEAADAIATATQLTRRHRWEQAATLLQRTADAPGDKLVRVSAGYYVGVRAHVANLIADWPPEGIEAYRTLFEADMRDALDDLSGERVANRLLPLLDRYFCTAAAGELVDIIGQLAIESGDLALAKRVYQRASDRHPDSPALGLRWNRMLAVASRVDDPAGALPEGVDPAAPIRWMGESRPLKDALASIARNFARGPARGADSQPDWPIFGGSPSRNRAANSRVDELGLLWRFHLHDNVGRSPDGREFATDMDHGSETDELSVQPVVSGGRVVIQQFRDLVALHRNTGTELWRFRADAGVAAEFDELEDRPPGWDSPTVHNGRVYATLPGDVVPYYGFESARSVTELLCLDLDSGRVIWRSNQDTHGESFTELHFDSSPIVANGRVYVVGRRRRSFGFEDCYLHCFEASDGTPVFRTHLGSASTGTFGSRQATMGIPTLVGDTVYVATNLGSVAAVSANTGTVRWLRLYKRDLGAASRSTAWPADAIDPWEFNPVLVSGDRLVCLPNDSSTLLVLSRADGRLLHAAPLADLSELRTLFGIRDGVLCGSGSEVVCYDVASGTLRWTSPFTREEVPIGRGTWVGDRLLVPTEADLLSIDAANGARTSLPWNTDAEPGNLVALPDRLIVAGGSTVSVYVRKSEIWAALHERMAASPDDPAPALDLAEVAFGSGETQQAIEALGQAVARAGNFAVALEPDLKRRLFGDAVTFAKKLALQSALEPDALDTLFGYASQCPPDRADHVAYRLAFASLFEDADTPERSLRLYQQILRDRSLRGFAPATNSSAGEPAGALAQERIAKLIERHGRKIYAPYETEAAQLLQRAIDVTDTDMLRLVAEAFPNANAAPVAVIEHGRLLSKAGQPTAAANQFATAYHRYPRQVDRPTLMRLIADAYEQANKPESAYLWLTKAAREHPNALIEVQGKRVTFGEYRDRLSSARKQVVPSRPSIPLPLDRHETRELLDGAALMTPRFDDVPVCDWSRYFLLTPAGVSAASAADHEALWATPAPVPLGSELLIGLSGVALFASADEVLGLDASTGRRIWSVGTPRDQAVEGNDDWEDRQSLRTHVMWGHRLISAFDDGTVVCLDALTGRTLWSFDAGPAPAGPIAATDSGIVYHDTQEGRAVLYCLDPNDGSLISRIETLESGTVEEVFVTLDGRVILATSHTVSAYDMETGRRRWQTDLQSRVQRATLLLDVDALYLSDDGRRMTKLSLEDGHVLWESQRLTTRGETGLAARLQDGTIIVGSLSSVTGVDAVTGMTLWDGTTPAGPHFAAMLLTDRYVLAVNVPDPIREAASTAYFYDHRNASGVIPTDGGARELGRLDNVREIIAVNGSVLIQDGSTLHIWTQP